MEKIPNTNESLRNKIEQAKKTALSLEDLEEVKDQQDQLTSDFIKGLITGQEYEEIEKTLDVKEGVVECNSIEDFVECLKLCNFSIDEISEIAKHEQSHYEVALSKGLEGFYQVQISKKINEDGSLSGFSFFPAVNIKFPLDMNDEDRRKNLKEIINAPLDLSPRDKEQIKETGSI